MVLNAGLGGMRPNIVVMGAYNLELFLKNKPLLDVPSSQNSDQRARESGDSRPALAGKNRKDSKTENLQGELPTDDNRSEPDISPVSYVTILEDLLLRLQINVAVARGFKDLKFPNVRGNTKKYIDLWPIQMSAEVTTEEGTEKQNVLTTNFDTYTLILQLGCILNTVDDWKKSYRLRVVVFVEYESDVEEERSRVQTLLTKLRINAEILVLWLASGEVSTYEVIVNGNIEKVGESVEREVDKVLKDEDWWQDIQKLRGRRGEPTASEQLADVGNLLAEQNWPSSSFPSNQNGFNGANHQSLKQLLRRSNRHRSSGNLQGFPGRLTMTTTRLHDEVIFNHATYASASEESDSDGEDWWSLPSGDDASARSKASAASDNDAEAPSDLSRNASGAQSPAKLPRRRSDGESIQRRSGKTTPSIQQTLERDSKAAQSGDRKDPTTPSTANLQTPASITSSLLSSTAPSQSHRPRPSRRGSATKFSSLPVPHTAISNEDGPGPSIMFARSTDENSPSRRKPQQPMYDHKPTASGTISASTPTVNAATDTNRPARPSLDDATPSSPSATGFPATQSITLSFNDLPCRAQHLILNELMRARSSTVGTAVVFTTLPGPVEGTCESEEESVAYLSDLEVLCEGLPPVLLIHSNSMTVTTNL